MPPLTGFVFVFLFRFPGFRLLRGSTTGLPYSAPHRGSGLGSVPASQDNAETDCSRAFCLLYIGLGCKRTPNKTKLLQIYRGPSSLLRTKGESRLCSVSSFRQLQKTRISADITHRLPKGRGVPHPPHAHIARAQ